MLTVHGNADRLNSRVARRDVLQAGLLGFGGLSLAGLLRRRALGAEVDAKRAVIMVCLNGGASHIDGFDPKPNAPKEVRGEFGTIRSSVPGLQLSELLPKQASIAERLVVIRSLQMIQPNHQLHECFTGHPTDAARPSFGSAVSATRPQHPAGLPRYVGLSIDDHPRTVAKAEQARYVGAAHAPFTPAGELLESMSPSISVSAARLAERRSLRRVFDRLRKEGHASYAALDTLQRQAMDILTSNAVRDAFDVAQEPEAVRRLYGEDRRSRFAYQFGHTWRNTFFLQARRLVEAGVPVVTLAPGAWDHHGGRQGPIFDRLRERLPLLDASLHALITDLHDRGLAEDVLVVVWGEFGRTPRVNAGAGRDHWTRANFAVLAGGGMPGGTVVGATDRTGSAVVGEPLGAQDVLALVYRHLGLDPAKTFTNFSGRPVPLLDSYRAIPGLG